MDQDPVTGEYIPGSRTRRSWQSMRAQVIQIPAFSTIGFGSMLAIAISYVHNQSIGWAILHGLLSWLFVLYAALFY